jgi:quercetin dioxygenase-like cupin family protein
LGASIRGIRPGRKPGPVAECGDHPGAAAAAMAAPPGARLRERRAGRRSRGLDPIPPATKGMTMELPPMINRLPEADLPLPAAALKTSVLQSPHGQLVFFQIFQDIEIPPHSHKGQWGVVLEGELEMTVDGQTRKYGPGDAYYIPAGIVHSAKVPAGCKAIDFFEEPDRYKNK